MNYGLFEGSTPQSDSSRLKTVLELLGISPYKMAKALQYKSPASIYNVINEEGNATLSIELANKIVSRFPNISYLYLTQGKGHPLLRHPSEVEAQQKLFPPNIPPVTAIPEKKDLGNNLLFVYDQLEILISNSRQLNHMVSQLLEENKKLREAMEEKN